VKPEYALRRQARRNNTANRNNCNFSKRLRYFDFFICCDLQVLDDRTIVRSLGNLRSCHRQHSSSLSSQIQPMAFTRCKPMTGRPDGSGHGILKFSLVRSLRIRRARQQRPALARIY